MSDDLSRLDPVKPEPGKYQWVRGKVTGIDDKQAERTHTVGVPHLMPGVVIFVHGVNSDGEGYFNASTEFQRIRRRHVRVRQRHCARSASRRSRPA